MRYGIGSLKPKIFPKGVGRTDEHISATNQKIVKGAGKSDP